MRLALVNGLRSETSDDLYRDIAGRVRVRGINVDLLNAISHADVMSAGYDLVFGNMDVAVEASAALKVYAGRGMTRPESLRLLERAGIPTMKWSLARTRREVWALWGDWDAERLLLKPSFTRGGTGVSVFTREATRRVRWNGEIDVFCAEVNPEDGDVYKAELFNGRILIAWKSAAPPIRDTFRRGLCTGLRGAYGDRSLCELPAGLAAKLEDLSRHLTNDGLGHVSVDLMRRPDGQLVAIELNPRGVATWWTRQFEHFRARYADALCELVVRPR